MGNPAELVATKVNAASPSVLSEGVEKVIVCPAGVGVAVAVNVGVGVLVGVKVCVAVAVLVAVGAKLVMVPRVGT